MATSLYGLFLSFVVCLYEIKAQVCPWSGISAGCVTNNQKGNSSVGLRYLLRGKGTVNCYGVIREWIFHTNDGCNAGGSIDFEVWRTVGNAYQLVGANLFESSSSCGVQTNWVTFGVAPIDQIPVEPGYVIGWNQKQNTLRISTDNPPVGTSSVSAIGDIAPKTPGDILTFNPQTNGIDCYTLSVTIKQGEKPVLNNLPASVNLTENTYPGSLVVFNVTASHVNNRVYADAVPLSFSISPSDGPFEIRNQSAPNSNGFAEIATKAGETFDYETQSIYQLSITVTGLGLTTTNVLTVNIVNVNEPHNTNLPQTVDVPASSTAAGDEVFVVIIYDPDLNPIAPVRCYLNRWSSSETTTDAPPFAVNTDTGSVTANVDLSGWYLRNPPANLPYPENVIYELTILSTDGIHNVSEILTVNITDIKQPPSFLNLPANISIDETTQPNTIIFQVMVSSGSDQIRYEILNAYQSLPFCVDEFTGDVSLCSYADLDACRQSFYSIEIEASNSVLSNSELLNVTINHVNSAPIFNQTTYYGRIYETTCNVGYAPVVTVEVIDRDSGPPCRRDAHVCTIMPGTGYEFFTINNCAVVVNDRCIDLDQFPEYETIVLLIKVRDSQSLSAYSNVIVDVINTNEHGPKFDRSVYSGSVEENAPGGKSILTVTATDDDWNNHTNGQFEYSIPPQDSSSKMFQVEPKSGIVKTKQPLDRETASSYSFPVIVTDFGSIPQRLSGSATVVVTIVNINDNRPLIVCDNRPSDEPYPPQPCFYNFDLIHDALIGHNVSYISLSAEDSDNAQNDTTFNLLLEDKYFNLQNNTGIISVKHSVEAYKKYLLYVYANDNGSPNMWSRIMNVRIDTYRRDRQYVDLTVKPKTSPFDYDAFLAVLRNVTQPWFMKIASSRTFSPDVQSEIVVTVYALADVSSYDPQNIGHKKVFVDRDEMLSRLRKNIYGDPEDILESPAFDPFPVIEVMPSYPNWWLDTVEGIATIVCLSVLGLVLLVFLILGILKAFGLLCFKKKKPAMPIHAWVDKEPSIARSVGADQVSVRNRSATSRRSSVSTVHSIILDKNL